MDDNKIVELFNQRDEAGIAVAKEKYHNYCYSISYNILQNNEDAEECASDTFLRAWNAIPPAHPNNLALYLGTIARRLSLNLYQKYRAKKRGFGEIAMTYDELEEVIPEGASISSDANHDSSVIVEVINQFLDTLPDKQRNIFVRRYWYLRSIEDIAKDYNVNPNNVKQILFRLRNKLRVMLEKKGVIV